MVRSIPPRTLLDKLREKGGREGTIDRGALRPRAWIYETRPRFKKVREPLVDVFKEAEEVRIVIDLGGFKRGEVDLIMKPDGYIISAEKNDHVFTEEIVFPGDVDTENVEERFKNGILEIVLQRKVQKADGAGRG
jgi:HSP20 family molecular chaperone IbpA